MIDRRSFLRTSALLALTSTAIAQPKDKLRRIALLSAFARSDIDPMMTQLRTELEKFGWIEGRTMTLLEPRTSEGRNDRLPALAAEVVALAPDVIIVFSAPATRALMLATATIPIVMWGVGDPVLYGIVRSYTEPGGNVTGSTALVNEATRKTLDLLKEAAPRIASVALFVNPTNEAAKPGLADLQEAAKARGVRIDVLEVRTAADFEAAFVAIRKAGSESLLLWPEALVRSQRAAIGRFAAEHRLPLAMVAPPRLLDAGVLLTYAASSNEYPVMNARYIDRILRGANPAKLPIEQPTKFELGISLLSAKALGLEISASLLARADVVIR